VSVGEPRRCSNRPLFHFTARRGWLNDPYGVTFHDGRYHLFFQHVPDGVAWRPQVHWGHAVSDDLVHWTELPHALAPGDGDDGIWSGSVVRTEAGEGRIFYTSVRSESWRLGAVRTARPGDADWVEWHKSDVVAVPPDDLDLVEFRDPFVLREEGGWRMVVGAGALDGTGLVLSWTSADLETWRYDGVLASRSGSEVDPVWTGTAWECPQLFPLGGSWVLVVSVWAEDVTRFEAYAVGDLVEGRFVARAWHRLTYGPAHYAGSAFVDQQGQRCLLHWLRGVADPSGRWAGAHSVPHVLRLDGDRVVAEPHPAVTGAVQPVLPGRHYDLGDASLQLDRDEVTVRTGADSFTVPCHDGPVQLLVDGQVVEVFGPQGVAGFVVGLRRPGSGGRLSADTPPPNL